MIGSDHDREHLARLVAAARAQAEKIDARAGVATLDEALREVHAVETGSGGGPDEGTRLSDLTTENDR